MISSISYCPSFVQVAHSLFLLFLPLNTTFSLSAGEFREDHFARAMASLSETGNQGQANAKKGKRGGTKGPSDCFRIVKMIMERSFQPVIVFRCVSVH